jgi:Secretion system C-terminal sorting domain
MLGRTKHSFHVNVFARNGGGGSAMIANSPTDVLLDLIVDAGAYPVLEEENEWTNKKSAYEALAFDSTFSNLSNPDLNTFVADFQNENIGTIALSDEMLKQYDLYFAKYLVNGLSPQNLMEQNYKTFRNYYILWCENPQREFSQSEINDLYSVANQCSNLGGKSVLQAQVFLDYILGQDGNWNTNCPLPASAQRKANQKIKEQLSETKQIDENFEIEISPNPANEQIIITKPKVEGSLNYAIVDLLGNKVLVGYIDKSKYIIDVSNLKNGSYFISFFNNAGVVSNHKIIISH